MRRPVPRWCTAQFTSPGHCHPQRLHSFWSAPRIAISAQTQFSEHVQSIPLVFSANQICHIWREVRESPTYGAGPTQKLRFLVLIKRGTASGDENAALAHSWLFFHIFDQWCGQYKMQNQPKSLTLILILKLTPYIHVLAKSQRCVVWPYLLLHGQFFST